MSRRHRSAAVVCAGLVAVTEATPAAAATDELGVSLDGRRWHATVTRPLFDSTRRWVPGDEQTATVWARNQSGADAVLTATLINRRGLLRPDLQLTGTANGRPCRLDGRTGYRLSGTAGPVRIELTAAFPEAAGNATQQQHAMFWLRLVLTDLPGEDRAGAGPVSCVPLPSGPAVSRARNQDTVSGRRASPLAPPDGPARRDGTAWLAGTGAGPTVAPVLVTGVALLIGSAVMFAVSRRRRTAKGQE